MEFLGKVAVVTGGAHGIGKCVCEQFAKEGAAVRVIDAAPNDDFVGDIGDEATLCRFAAEVVRTNGHVDFLIHNAPPTMRGIADCTFAQFEYALRVGVTAPFFLTQQLLPYFAKGAAIVNLSSSRDGMSQPQTESYAAAKGGIAALTHALAVSLAGRVRVNAISPGWIDVTGADYSGADAAQHPVGRVGTPLDIAHMVLFLCSERAGFLTGENIRIDGGMTRQMIYHGEHGWSFDPAGILP